MSASATILPGLAPADEWVHVSTADAAAVALANRHYSRRRVGHRIGGPWKCLALLSGDGSALWLSTYTKRPMDGLDAVRCSIFRNEGDELSSNLITKAMERTVDEWSHIAAPDGWVTWVNAAEVASTNPGFCFKQAGWWRDRTYSPDRRRASLVRLRATWEATA